MSFQAKLRLEGYFSRGLKRARANKVRLENENDFPFATVDFIRVGSAHAVQRCDQQDLIRAMESIVHEIEAKYQPDHPRSQVVVELK
jgi:hypothetical protein